MKPGYTILFLEGLIGKIYLKKTKIIKITGGISPEEIALRAKKERDEILARLKNEGFTIGQLERATGISRGIVTRANV